MSAIVAALRLLRPFDGLIAVVALVVAVYLADGSFALPLFESMALFSVVSFGYVVNDIYDLETDRKSKPSRPLPSGALSVRQAWILAVACLVLAAVVVAQLPATEIIYFVALALLLLLYAWRLSSILLVGNLVVAFACSSVFVLGALTSRALSRDWTLVSLAILFSFLHHLGREVVKDMADTGGDKLAGRVSIPLACGFPAAKAAAVIAFSLLIASTYAAFVVLDISSLYLAVVTIAVNMPLFAVMLDLRNRSIGDFARPALAIKLIMLPGLLALILARGI